MSNNIAIIVEADESLTIIFPNPNSVLTEEEIFQKDAPNGVRTTIDVLPPRTRPFRNAWRWDGSTVYEDLELSRAEVQKIRRYNHLSVIRPLKEDIELGEDVVENEAAIAAASAKYNAIKAEVEAATNVDALFLILDREGWL